MLTEIMYRPGSTNTGGEFIELHNLTNQPVVLQDLVTTQLSSDPMNIGTGACALAIHQRDRVHLPVEYDDPGRWVSDRGRESGRL